MSLITRIKAAAEAFRSGPNISLSDLDAMMVAGETVVSSAGVPVSERTGTRQATVFSCINILARDMAALPLKLYERTGDHSSKEVATHPMARIVRDPNGAMTSMQFHMRAWASVLASGNDYCEILRSKGGDIRLWPLDSARMQVKVSGTTKYYEYFKADGKKIRLEDEDVVHHYGLSFDGFVGVSPIRWCMEAVGHAIAVGEYGSAYFQSPVPKVILKHPSDFKGADSREAFSKAWRDRFAGKKGLATVAVLPNGMDVAQIVKIPNEEAQFIESRKFSKEEIAQLYQMPLHRLQALDRATFSNIEHQDLEYVKYTLVPWLRSREQALDRALLTAAERDSGLFFRYNVDALLRGDFKTRQEGFSLGIQTGKLTINEARALDNMPPLEGGDIPMFPLNFGKLTDIQNPPAPEPAPPAPDDQDEEDDDERQLRRNVAVGFSVAEVRAAAQRRAIAMRYQPQLEAAFARISAVDRSAIEGRLADLDGTGSTVNSLAFIDWLETYTAGRSVDLQRAIAPVVASIASDVSAAAAREVGADPLDVSKFAGDTAQRVAEQWNKRTVAILAADAVAAEKTGESVADAVNDRLGYWDGGPSTRANQAARQETNRVANAVSGLIFASVGLGLRWVTFGENCPYCNEMRGKRVAIGEAFVPIGEFSPPGASRPLKIKGLRKHPPLHKGCDCMVAPG